MVTEDTPNHSLVSGKPARIAGWVCECLNRLDFHSDIAICDNCKKQYIRHECQIGSLERGIRCIGCECGGLLNLEDDVTDCDDCKKQPDNCKERIINTMKRTGSFLRQQVLFSILSEPKSSLQ